MTDFASRIIALIFLIVAFQPTIGFPQTAPTTATSRDQERLALLPFGTRGFSSEEGTRLRRNFATGLAESKRFDVMPDTVLKNNLKQAGRTSIDGCTTPPCLAQLGNVLNVEKIVHLQAERWEQRFMLHIRLVRSSDAALLYDERVDYSGDVNTLASVIAPEQGRKLAAAFLDKKPDWILLAAALLPGTGLVFWLLRRLGSVKNSAAQTSPPDGPPQ